MRTLPPDPTAGTHQLVVTVDIDGTRLDDLEYIAAVCDQVAGLAHDRLRRNPLANRRLHICLAELARQRRVQPWAVMGGSRRRGESMVRHELMWIGVRCARLSLAEMGDWLGGMDHTSVLSGRRKIDGMIASDRRVAKRLMWTWEQTAPKMQEAA